MIKSELVQHIATRNPHLYQRDVENIVNAILDEIVAAMARGDRVELRGFGAFSVKNRPQRPGRNPRRGATSWSTRRTVPSSRPARKWRMRVRHLEREARTLRHENERLQRRAGVADHATVSLPLVDAPRLTIPPPR